MNTNTFPFNGTNLRTVEIDGTPWLVAADVFRLLGMEVTSKTGGATKRLTNLDADEKRTVRRGEEKFLPLFAGGHAVALILISESGYNKLIMRANPSRPEVAEVQNWIARDVLPAIRKTGGYLLNEEAREGAHADNRSAPPELVEVDWSA
jgi:prophage antirepressor-like protein